MTTKNRRPGNLYNDFTMPYRLQARSRRAEATKTQIGCSTYIYVYIHTYLHIYTQIYLCIYTCLHAHICVYYIYGICLCVRVCDCAHLDRCQGMEGMVSEPSVGPAMAVAAFLQGPKQIL